MVWFDMAGPEGQSSSAGATIKGFNKVETYLCLDLSIFLAGSCS